MKKFIHGWGMSQKEKYGYIVNILIRVEDRSWIFTRPEIIGEHGEHFLHFVCKWSCLVNVSRVKRAPNGRHSYPDFLIPFLRFVLSWLGSIKYLFRPRAIFASAPWDLEMCVEERRNIAVLNRARADLRTWEAPCPISGGIPGKHNSHTNKRGLWNSLRS